MRRRDRRVSEVQGPALTTRSACIWPARSSPGYVELREGARLSGAEIFYIDIKGVGGHGSRPDLTINPIQAAVDVYQRLLTIPSTHHSMFDTCVVSPCCLKAGERFNIVPETAHIEGTIRYYKIGDGEVIMEKIRNGCPDHLRLP